MHEMNNLSQQLPVNLRARVIKRIRQVVIQFLLIAVLLFASAGRLDWLWAWVYLGTGIVILAINASVMSPELIAERGEPRENVKKWDRVLTTLTIIPTFALFVIVGLDERFKWSPELPLAVHVVALLIATLGQGVFTWAMASNKYFSTAVRIQMDRGHTVATGGPYRYVRHPGYAAFIITWLCNPLLFGSLWALIPGGIIAVFLIVRTALEDRTLWEELEGYKEYAQRVRYRLVPGIW